MFSSIDNACINLAQWLVRQVELFTPFTRKALSTYFILFAWVSLIASMGTYILLALKYPGVAVCFLAASLILRKFLWTVTMRVLIQQSWGLVTESLPKEIYSRTRARGYCWYGLFFIGPLGAMICVFFFQIPGLALPIQLIISFLSLSRLVPEYFLCTKSLPPGERAKSRQERELRGMKTVPMGV